MKKLTQIFFLSAVVAGLGMTAGAAEQKIALFDMRKAFDSYYKTIQSDKSLKQEASEAVKEREQMVEEGRRHVGELTQLREKAGDQALSAEERDKAKKAIPEKEAELQTEQQSLQQFDQMAESRLQEKKRQHRDDIVKEIRGVVDAHAKSAGYSLVLDPSGESTSFVPVVLYSSGIDDLTESIIKELNAAAPPGSLDTNSVPSGVGATNLFQRPSFSK